RSCQARPAPREKIAANLGFQAAFRFRLLRCRDFVSIQKTFGKGIAARLSAAALGTYMRHIWLLVPAVLGVAASAEARPRDDALSGAIRCGVIVDSRQWLNCFYGAAQPVRAGLGLVPAPAAQIQLAASPPQGGVPRD